MKQVLHDHRWAAVIVTMYAVLAIVYSLTTPVFEASDEISHYPVIQYVATTGGLPIQHPGVTTMWEQEGSQPPLYYIAGAALTFWIDTSDLPTIRSRNPHAKLGIPLDPDNKNMVLHTDAEGFPWKNTLLAVHLLRLFSILLGVASVVLCYGLAITLWPRRLPVAWLATALMAFNPMFLFVSGSVNNDNLMILLGTWIMLLCVRTVLSGFSARRIATLSVITALATITKISGLAFVPVVGLTIIIRAWQTRQWRPALASGLAIAVTWLTLAGWWYLRNWNLYHELLGTNMQILIAGGRQIALRDLFQNEWYGFWVSYWALFGAVNILAEPFVYVVYGIISVLSIIGLVRLAADVFRQRSWAKLLLPGLLALQIVILFVGLVRWTLMTYASQGRLMFPAIAIISALMAIGLLVWVPSQWQYGMVGGLSGLLVTIAIMSPFRYIAPTYARSPIVASIPRTATPVGARFDGLELVAVETYSATVHEGEFIPVTLYWRASQPLTRNTSVFLHALGRNYATIGKIDSYPGGGTWPATIIKPGEIIKDEYKIELNESFSSPTIVRLQIGMGLWTPDRYSIIDGIRADGGDFGNIIVEAGVAYPSESDTAGGCNRLVSEIKNSVIRARFDEFAQLHTSELTEHRKADDSITVTLVWEQIGQPAADLTVFVHLIDSHNVIVAQADAPPVHNDYPTRLWRIPCEVEDAHTLQLPDNLPAGDYRILVGLYDANQATYPRIDARQPDGTPYPENAVPVGTITVEAK